MAPISRTSHLLGMGAFAVVYGVLRTALLFGVVAAFLDVSFRDPSSSARRWCCWSARSRSSASA